MSPLELEIMLHCYTSDVPWENMKHEIWLSPASRDARDMLKGCGLLDADLRPTPNGKQFVESLLSLSSAICRNVSRMDHQMTERRDSHPGR